MLGEAVLGGVPLGGFDATNTTRKVVGWAPLVHTTASLDKRIKKQRKKRDLDWFNGFVKAYQATEDSTDDEEEDEELDGPA